MKKQYDKDKIKEQLQPYETNATDRRFPVGALEEERYEIVEGIRYDMLAAPKVVHQQLLAELYLQIHATCHDNGIILFAPLTVYLDEDNQFQPDLIFILHERSHIVKKDQIEGAPDLVVEILSRSTSQRDKITKKRQYCKHGVSEYWIVDPEHRTIDQFILENGTYLLAETYGFGDRLRSTCFACLAIDMDKLLRVTLESE